MLGNARERPAGQSPFGYGEAESGSSLQCEQVPLVRLAKRFATPLYVYSASAIRARVRDFDQAFGGIPHTICYSVKANSNLGILRLLARTNCGFDVVSGGEVKRVLRVGRPAAKKAVFSGVGKTREEMRAALKAEILLFNVESESELQALAECAARLKKTAAVALRVNPDVPANTHPYISTGLHQHKFGVPVSEAVRLYTEASKRKYLKVSGVSVHIGSQITDVQPFAAAMERVADLVRTLRFEGHSIKYVDAGGGLGIDYQGESECDFSQYAAKYANAVCGPLRNLDVHLLLEPGRSIVGPAGVLITKVLYKKSNNGKRFVVVDAAMNDLLRPVLYGAYHKILPVWRRGEQVETVDVVGPVCETGDFFARDRELPAVQEGDLLAIMDIGAYGMVLASNYNSRPRPAEVLVNGKSVKLIRRRETTADLLRAEK
ncbi:MAG TPA: diaminopimelate decarboxylase [Terriglobales bacterium]|nr:diaminopimelate decarboxylase [Terriglobales bacterium]